MVATSLPEAARAPLFHPSAMPRLLEVEHAGHAAPGRAAARVRFRRGADDPRGAVGGAVVDGDDLAGEAPHVERAGRRAP